MISTFALWPPSHTCSTAKKQCPDCLGCQAAGWRASCYCNTDAVEQLDSLTATQQESCSFFLHLQHTEIYTPLIFPPPCLSQEDKATAGFHRCTNLSSRILLVLYLQSLTLKERLDAALSCPVHRLMNHSFFVAAASLDLLRCYGEYQCCSCWGVCWLPD